MTQESANFCMDTERKESIQEICQKTEMNVTTDSDPFYNENNIHYLEKKAENYKAGKLRLVEHKLIE